MVTFNATERRKMLVVCWIAIMAELKNGEILAAK